MAGLKKATKKQTVPEFLSGLKARKAYVQDVTQEQSVTDSVRDKCETVNEKYSQRDSTEGLTKEEAKEPAQAYTRLRAENEILKERYECHHTFRFWAKW